MFKYGDVPISTGLCVCCTGKHGLPYPSFQQILKAGPPMRLRIEHQARQIFIDEYLKGASRLSYDKIIQKVLKAEAAMHTKDGARQLKRHTAEVEKKLICDKAKLLELIKS